MDDETKPEVKPGITVGLLYPASSRSGDAGGAGGPRKPKIEINLLYKPRIVLGVIFLLLGVLLTLRNLGVIEVGSALHFWPLVLVAIGLSGVLQPRESNGRGLGLTLLLIGVWLQLSYFGLIPFRIRDLWPVIFVLIGGNLIWHGLPRGVALSTSAATVNAFAIGGGVEWKTSSQVFRGGDASAILGGCDLDLSKASIEGDEAVIDVLAFWGGVEIRVPEEWNVSVKGTPILGAFNDRTHPPKEGAGKTLIIRGVAIMGGVEIKN
jgi:predicted membrane protein